MLKWIGHLKGVEGLPDIPARDLSEDEIEQYGGEAALVATGLYERPHGPLPVRTQAARLKEEPVDD